MTKIPREEYLDVNFDYKRLTKQELRDILSENNIADVPPLTALKSAILDVYKEQIHDRIESIKSNFSNENIFQNEEQQGSRVESEREQSRSQMSNNTLHSIHSRASAANESSEMNSTAFSRKAKTPFIIIPKKRNNVSTRRFPVALLVFTCAFVAICVYFKFYCPYCTPDSDGFCVPVPSHARLVNSKIVCDQGYRMVHGVVDVCVPYNMDEITRKCDDYIRMLEYLRGDFIYGRAKTPRIRASLVTDPQVLRILRMSPKVTFNGDWVEAKGQRTSVVAFTRFYAVFLVKGAVVLLVLLISLRLYIKRRRINAQRRAQAGAIAKEVLDILNRQIMMSVRSTQFKPHVQAQQMRDALDVKDEIWKHVEEIIVKNSNVEKTIDEHGRNVWKWIGPVLHKTESPELQ